MRRWRLKDDRGAAAVEMGFLLPIFLLMLYGIVQLGLMLWTQASLYHGAQMAARCAALQQSACSSTALTQQYAADQSYGLHPDASTFTISTQTCGIQVAAAYSYQPFSALMSSLSIALSARACFLNS